MIVFLLQEVKKTDNSTTCTEIEKVTGENSLETDEAKKIVESMTDSMTNGNNIWNLIC